MTPHFTTAVRLLAPFLVAELAVMGIVWFLVPEGSWLMYALWPISAVVLPSVAAARLTRASFTTGAAVSSALAFAAVGLVWTLCAAALGYAGPDWEPYLLGALISTAMIGAPLQLLAAYVGASQILLTQQVATFADWNRASIEARQTQLAALALKTWPT
jgi:hypothetical protein